MRPPHEAAPRPDPDRSHPAPGRIGLAVLVLATALGALVALSLPGCATNPVTGRREFTLVTTAQEEQMGREGFAAVLSEFGSYDDAAVQAYVSDVGHRVARVSHLPDLDWHFTVIDDPAVNAFAMPGGYVYVTRGILAHLNSEAQLAGVLGHEIGHVTHRHSAEQITRQQVAGLGLGAATILSPTLARYGSLAQQGLGLLFLSYSRTNESEADELGVEYATKAGYDPNEIPSTYAMLKRVSDRGGQRLPAFLSTHPDPGDREARTTRLAQAASAGKSGLVVRGAEYVHRLDGAVFGDDPRQGYFEGDDFYHPGLGFILSLPSGWTRQNARATLTAVARDGPGAMQLSLADGGSLSPGAFVAKLESDGRIVGSRGANERVGGFPAWVGRLTVAEQSGGQRVLPAAFIRKGADQLFQILGRSAQPDDADFARVLASARSFRPLTDPSRLSPSPGRVRVNRVGSAGSFASLVAGFGPQGIDLEDTAILNNRAVTDRVDAGGLIKTVTPSRLR